MNSENKPHDHHRAATGYAIQPAIWPEAEISTECAPYIRLDGPAGLSLTRGGVTFGLGGSIKVDGYFNLFNLGKWRKFCGDLPIELWLQGTGKFQLTVWLINPHRSSDRIYSEVISLDGTLTVPLDLDAPTEPRTILSFDMVALSDGQLEDFAWATPEPPRQTPELALSVTTFKRENAVAKTADRFRKFRADWPHGKNLHMFIVDNGQSVSVPSGEGITVIPNANLGGAGGFTRGLLEARKAGYSHCLFMDDDASIHMGAIIRTWMFLSYTIHPNVAVAGAMINADYRWQIWENGAIFDRGCRPQFFGLDMRDRDETFKMEFSTTDMTPEGLYAGWWYFAFPVDDAKHLAFPFFVRGDDVSFSLANQFKIVTLPGVGSFQESFTDKASPLNWYLDMRSHLAHHLSFPAKEMSWIKLQRLFISFYLRTVLRFHYDSLAAVNLAIEDVLRGPEFFADNADMAKRRNEIKQSTTVENWSPVTAFPNIRIGKSGRPLRALLLATLNGHLLPFSKFMGTELVLDAAHRDDFRAVYGARRITYLNAQQTASYTVTMDRSRFWAESLRIFKNSLKLLFRHKYLQNEWQSNYSYMTSEEFWRKKLDLPSP